MRFKSEQTRRRYDRIAPFYDLMNSLAEHSFAVWRRQLWQQVNGDRVLEVGVGTGKNIPYYPPQSTVTAIDLSPKMLLQAKKQANRSSVPITLSQADVQSLPFEDNSFDIVVATFVFCSVPDPLLGLQEIRRVLVKNGQLFLLEHVLSEIPFLQWNMNLLNPLLVRLTGANINRRTVENVQKAGFEIIQVKKLWLDVVKYIEARNI